MDPPEISLILNELKLTDDLVANIYFHGSWAQGTCTNKSDQDLIIVTRRFQSPLRLSS
jgi:predicted nucleotidyltransferase